MADWLSYAPSDFLMFGPEVYWRLFELHNQALWPLPVVSLGVGIAIIGGLAAPVRWRAHVIWLSVALTWVGAAHFLAVRYAPINWPMHYAVWAFGAQAALIAIAALMGVIGAPDPPRGIVGPLGFALLAYAVLLHPFVGLVFDRPIAQAEILGLAPDPTALASLGLLLMVDRSRWRLLLSVIPALWCLASSATLLTLDESQGWVLLIAVGLWGCGVVVEATRGGARREHPGARHKRASPPPDR